MNLYLCANFCQKTGGNTKSCSFVCVSHRNIHTSLSSAKIDKKKVSLGFYPLSFLSVMVKSKCNLSKLEFNVKLLMLPVMNRELGMSEARKGSWFGSVHMFVDFIKELFVDSLVI